MNIIDIGINLQQWEADKAALLQSAREMFAELNAYEGVKVNPVSVTGMTQLNESIKQQTISLAAAGDKLTEVTALMNAYTKLAIQTDTVQGKINASFYDEAKANAAAKVELAERNKILIEEARLSNETYQARLQRTQQEKDLRDKDSADKKAKAEESKRLIKEEEDVAKAMNELKRRLAAEEALRSQKQIKADKDATLAKQQKAKADAEELKRQALLNDNYKQFVIQLEAARQKYAQLYFAKEKDAAATKQAYIEYEALHNLQIGFNKTLAASEFSLGSVSKAMTSFITQLRYLAYIIPGVGIAGLFTLAYELIGNVVSSLFEFNEKLEETEARTKAINDALQEELDLYQELYEIRKRFSDLSSDESVAAKRRELDVKAAQGLSQTLLLPQQVTVAEQRFNQALTNLGGPAGVDTYTKSIKSLAEQTKDYADMISDIDLIVNAKDERTRTQKFEDFMGKNFFSTKYGKIVQGIKQTQSDAELKAIKESMQSQLNVMKTNLGEQIDTYNEYVESKLEADSKSAEYTKFLSDEERKIRLNNTKEEVAGEIQKNNIILQQEKSTEAERIAAVKRIAEQQKILAFAEQQNVLQNVSSNRSERVNARRDYGENLVEIDKETNEKIRQVQLQYYLRFIAAETQQFETQLQIQDIGYQRIEKNEKDSYGNRLQALAEFNNNRRIEIEVARGLALDQARAQGKTPEEQSAIGAGFDKQRAELENNTQSQVTSIIQSWFSRQMRLIEDQNALRLNTNIASERDELKALNDSLDAKGLKWKDYLIQRKALEERYKLSGDREAIENDKSTIAKLEDLRKDVDAKLAQNQKDFTGAQTPEDATKFADIQNTLLDSRKQIDLKIVDNTKKKNEDELKYELDRQKKIEEGEKQLYQNRQDIIKALFEFAQTVSDSYYERQEEKLERNKELTDEMYANEQSNLERSSLSAKDKNAYEVQLAAQKSASDKRFAKEERKIQHDQAVMSRDIKIAEIILNTEQAITKAYAEVPFPLDTAVAISYGVLGGIALATAIATKIPSYKEGVIDFGGGYARYGEAGHELVKEPGKEMRLVTKETISYLPKGTDIIPMYKIPTVDLSEKDESWEQTKFIANAISKGNKKQLKAIINTQVKVDLGKEAYKNMILHG